MVYIPVPEQVTDDIWTAANMNIFVRDNFAAGIPGLFTSKGDLAVGTGVDDATRLAAGTEGQWLQTSSGTISGLEWVAVVAGRTGGHATNWEMAGTSTYIPGAVKLQCGCIHWTGTAAGIGAGSITYPYHFGDKPILIMQPVSPASGGPVLVTTLDGGDGSVNNYTWRMLSGTASNLDFYWMALGIP